MSRKIAVYDASCTICTAAKAASRRCEDSVRWVSAGEWAGAPVAPDSIVVIDESGHRLERSAAVAMIVGEWRFVGGPIAAVMRRLERPLDALYVVVAGNRHALGAPLRVGRRLVALIRR